LTDVAAPRSSVTEVNRLTADLHSTDSVRRDAAVARLRIIGGRALSRLADVITSDSTASARALALNALEGVDDARAVDVALAALGDADSDTVVAALGVLRGWVANEEGTRLLEAIAAIAVDATRHTRVRLAALGALSDLPEDLVQPIRAQSPAPDSAGPPLEEPAALYEWIDVHGGTATLSALHELVTRVRELEQKETSARQRGEWLRARGQAHHALARRGSLVALYDVREAFEGAKTPLPQEFLSTAAAIGDASCLEPLARAWSASPKDVTWRHQLSTTAATIARRARLNGRSAIIKRLKANWPGFL
jgi:hypothetical protein